MTIQDAPWWARLMSIVISQAALCLAQYLAFLQGGGPVVTLGIAVLQAIQGSAPAFGLGAWRAAGSLVSKLARGKEAP